MAAVLLLLYDKEGGFVILSYQDGTRTDSTAALDFYLHSGFSNHSGIMSIGE